MKLHGGAQESYAPSRWRNGREPLSPDMLATAFQHAACGQATARDHEAVAGVLSDLVHEAQQTGQVAGSRLVGNAARRYGLALAAAIREGSPLGPTLQAFLDL